ncbi:hypothetical protein [Fodinicola feengrottensis]|uniref:hypothetical protein n=1 Tax=Fodinicola feengrottensis TaxID=435914 RepID=UPI0013D16B70|nr:hypothetical protein [Fodinicola feengrottensis]
MIIEQTHLNHAEQKVTFVGAAEHPDRDGVQLHASTDQPIFHVEHSVGGDENRPLNEWRIVHLAAQPDERLLEVFARIDADPWLPEFIEIYIRDVLGIGLARRADLAGGDRPVELDSGAPVS